MIVVQDVAIIRFEKAETRTKSAPREKERLNSIKYNIILCFNDLL